jgi:RNA polymerase sigma-70 factor (ECF subfamily)
MNPSARREEEFLALLAQHKYELFNLIFCVLRSIPDTEDLYQETVLALWTDFDRFEPGSNFMAWSSCVARHRIWNFIRSRRRRQTYFSDSIIQLLAETPFESADRQEARLEALSHCREKLSAADQQLVLHCYGGGTIREAAERMGRPAKAVYASLARIRRALQECIERTLAREERI